MGGMLAADATNPQIFFVPGLLCMCGSKMVDMTEVAKIEGVEKSAGVVLEEGEKEGKGG